MENIIYFIGLDIDSRSVQIAVIDSKENLYLNKKVKGIDLLSFIENEILKKFSQENTLVLMESTSSSYHLYPTFTFQKYGYLTKVINPVLIKKFSEFKSIRRKKTDKNDAKTIAEFALKELYPLLKRENIYLFTPNVNPLKFLSRN